MSRWGAPGWIMARIFLLVFLLGAAPAPGYIVGPPLELDKLAGHADLIFQGTTGTGLSAADPAFQAIPGFACTDTVFQVVAVLQGADPGKTVTFRHYAPIPGAEGMGIYQPQAYAFTPGRTYLVFAKRDAATGTWLQIWMSHTGIYNQGALLCADARPLSGTVREAFWTELTGLLRGPPADAVQGIRTLDAMSGGGGTSLSSTHDFERDAVIAATRGSMFHPDPGVARAAIGLVGGHNPYMSDERAPFWLATVGDGLLPGLSRMDPQMRNPGGETCADDLAKIADGPGDAGTRAEAAGALGLTRRPELRPRLERWLADPAPAVRAAATLLLAGYPDLMTPARMTALAADPDPSVRRKAAVAVGYAQRNDLAAIPAGLLGDSDPKVRRDAAMSLLSFSPRREPIAPIFRANANNPEFFPLFLLGLAKTDPARYREDLFRIAAGGNATPKNWGGGQIPSYTAQAILDGTL